LVLGSSVDLPASGTWEKGTGVCQKKMQRFSLPIYKQVCMSMCILGAESRRGFFSPAPGDIQCSFVDRIFMDVLHRAVIKLGHFVMAVTRTSAPGPSSTAIIQRSPVDKLVWIMFT
jgi:hypothetical protein